MNDRLAGFFRPFRLMLAMSLLSVNHTVAKEKNQTPHAAGGPKSSDLIRAAKAAYGEKRYDDAIAKAGEALAAKPSPRNAAVAHEVRAGAYIAKDDLGNAELEAETAIHLRPEFPGAHTLLGLVYQRLGNNERAVEEDTRAIQLKAHNLAEVYTDRGIAYARLGKYELALRDYNEALRIDPLRIQARLNRAGIYYKLGEKDKALVDATELVRQNPNAPVGHYNRGILLVERGRTPEGISEFDIAAQLAPDDPSILCARASAYRQMKQIDRAIADYLAASEKPAKRPEDNPALATAFCRLGDYSQAAEHFREARRSFPDDNNLENAFAYFEATCPDPAYRNGEEALSLATKVCERTKWKDAATIDTLAAAYAETCDFEEALKYEKQALDLASDAAIRDEMEKTLRSYEAHQPCREEPLKSEAY